MKTTRRQVLATSLAASLGLVATAGCSSDSGTTAGGTETEPLAVWFPGTDQAEMALVKDTLVPEFEKQTGSHVNVTYVDWADISPKLNAAFAAGTAPDVFGHGVAATAGFAKNDRIEDLSPYVAKMNPTDRDDLGNALPGGKVDGKQYMVPLLLALHLLVYSAKDFSSAGLDPDSPPKTWEDLRSAAEKLTKRNGKKVAHSGLALPSQPIGNEQSFATLLWSNGGSILGPDRKSVTLETPESVQALQYFTNLYQGPAPVDGFLGVNWAGDPPNQQPIVTGKASMQLSGLSSVDDLQKAAPERDVRVMMPPSFAGHDPATFGGPANGLMMNKDSKNKTLSWKFIEFMISKDINTKYCETLGYIPIRKSAADSAYVKNSKALTLAIEAMKYAHGNPNVASWVQIRDQLDKSLERALYGKQSPTDALKEAAAQVGKLVAGQ